MLGMQGSWLLFLGMGDEIKAQPVAFRLSLKQKHPQPPITKQMAGNKMLVAPRLAAVGIKH